MPNKKDSILNLLKINGISVCCLQETEIPKNFPEKVLSSGGYNLELETNEEKKRVGVYLRNDIKYERKLDLDKAGMHIIIVDILLNVKIRLINVCRSFRPPNGVTPDEFFKLQL